MKKGWFELDNYRHENDYIQDSSKMWRINIYSYEGEDESTPDVTLNLNTTSENGNGYCLVELSITYVGRSIMFDEVIALVKRLDEISINDDSVSLTEHLVVCREFFDCGRMLPLSHRAVQSH
ncbi:hypothetical protein [Paenibacillus sp. CF384]|uniref:hypothetical protein n=1 Tax=Paenibacillus sp. CF384 TaxID=1884382 RepID=UPI000899AA17|nr:hypothetical protein [Paenibacillus sp. CF384]SDX94550.1 hypothetical protein SAMN05518855_103023 [Paenibacillus sp. CF384]